MTAPRRWTRRIVAGAAVAASALVAHAVGSGDLRATPEVALVTVTSLTGSGSGTATLQNTTSATTYNVLVGSDATCDPAIGFTVPGGNPIVGFAPQTSRNIQLECPPRGTPAMRRCLHHATNSANGLPLADFLAVCLYGSTPGTLAPQQTVIDFGTVPVGEETSRTLELRHDGMLAQTITRVYLQTTDLDGNFRFSTPCNPDAPYCDEDLAAHVGAGGTVAIEVKCTPQTPGTFSADVLIGTDSFQLLGAGVTLQCIGDPAAMPVLAAHPSRVDVLAPVEVTGGSASTAVHLANAGTGTLIVTDVRIVDVDTGAAADWTYSASGACTGQIASACSLDAGDEVALALAFDPSAIGRRRATLLVSYRDTIDRTREILLDATGLGATLQLGGGDATLPFGAVPVGRSADLDIHLVNRGNRDTTAMLAIAQGTTPPYSLTPPATAVVAPGVTRPITVTCAPTAAGATTATITAQAPDTFASAPISVTTTCEGSTLALYASPTSLVLGEVRIGAPVRRTVLLLSANTGSITLAGQPQLESPVPQVTLGPLSAMTTPATFDVTIDPQTEGQLAATIRVADNGGGVIEIPLVARVVRASYAVSPSLDLGTFCVGQPTTSSNLALVSDGTATIGLSQPTLGMTPSAFQLSFTSPSGYPRSLAAGTAATLAVTPLRQAAVTTVSDMLTWRTDVDAALTATTSLGARFIDSGGAIAPTALDFGKVTVHIFEDDGQRVRIQNCNPTPLVLDPPMIRTPFSIDSPNFPSMLDPNETVTFSVGFHPTRTGVAEDTLRITSPQLPGMPLEVRLTGEGIAPVAVDAGVDPPGPGNTSFYACTCRAGSPAGIAPILLALGLFAIPRRRARR